ncbi:MAG: heme NO-binding domain-containing protein [bacterium]|nr:heme NO-binding domain-containing protein [bacterium]
MKTPMSHGEPPPAYRVIIERVCGVIFARLHYLEVDVHGSIHLALKQYVVEVYGASTWEQILAQSNATIKMYLATSSYPDGEITALITAASALANRPANDMIEDFGRYLMPKLIQNYRSLVRPEWRTLDFLENAEQSIHSVVRVQNPGARPPILRCVRHGASELQIIYSSARRLCALVRGMALGAAQHFAEVVMVDERQCMLHGAESCDFRMRVVA